MQKNIHPVYFFYISLEIFRLTKSLMKNNLWSCRHVLKTTADSLGVLLLPYASFATHNGDDSLHIPAIKSVESP